MPALYTVEISYFLFAIIKDIVAFLLDCIDKIVVLENQYFQAFNSRILEARVCFNCRYHVGNLCNPLHKSIKLPEDVVLAVDKVIQIF